MKTLIVTAILIIGTFIVVSIVLAKKQPEGAGSGLGKSSGDGVHSFTMRGIDGENIPLSRYRGKVLLIVNTASKCGYTKQYAGMEELYKKYKDQGLEVLAFPANNFMGQEPGSDTEIRDFCRLTYKATFPVFAKTSVKGADINPLYDYLTTRSGFNGPIKWNFNKFLVDMQGNVVNRFDSPVDPMSPQITAEIERFLPKR